MATANAKKLPPTATTSTPTRGYKAPGSARSTPSTARSATPSKDLSNSSDMKVDTSASKAKEGVKSPGGTPFSAKAALQRRGTNNTASEATEMELESAAEMDELRKRLAESEAKNQGLAEEIAVQAKALQARVDEAQSEQAKLEEHLQVKTEAVENLEADMKELQRAKRDQEKIYEAEVSFSNRMIIHRATRINGKCRGTL